METWCVGRFLMRTLFYRLTSKRKHLPLPKNAVKENGFIFASLTSCYFHFLYFYHPDCFLHKQKISSTTYENRRERKLPFSDFWSSFIFHFKIPRSTCDTLIRNINFRFLYTGCKSLFYRGSWQRIKYLRHSNT